METQSSQSTMVGGQFDLVIGLTKQTLYINIGKAYLKWAELELSIGRYGS